MSDSKETWGWNKDPLPFNIYKWYFWKIEMGDIIPVWWNIVWGVTSHLEIDEIPQNTMIDIHEFEGLYNKQKSWIEEYLNKAQIDAESRMFFALWNVQTRIQKALKTMQQTDLSQRSTLYNTKGQVKLSELIWNSACAERAALWTYVLYGLWIEAYYMAWYSFQSDIDDGEPHSWIIIPWVSKTLIFDVARPITIEWGQELPNIYRINGEFNKEIIWKSDNFYVEAKSVYWWRNSLHFWVWDGRMSSEIPNIVNTSSNEVVKIISWN